MSKRLKAAYCGAIGILGLAVFTISLIHLVEQPLYIIPAVLYGAVFLQFGNLMDKEMSHG